MEEGRILKHRIGYEGLLSAVGRFCDEEKLDEICLVEFEKGLLLQSIKVESTGEGYVRRMVTHTWSYEQVAEMASRGRSSSAGPAPEGKGGRR